MKRTARQYGAHRRRRPRVIAAEFSLREWVAAQTRSCRRRVSDTTEGSPEPPLFWPKGYSDGYVGSGRNAGVIRTWRRACAASSFKLLRQRNARQIREPRFVFRRANVRHAIFKAKCTPPGSQKRLQVSAHLHGIRVPRMQRGVKRRSGDPGPFHVSAPSAASKDPGSAQPRALPSVAPSGNPGMALPSQPARLAPPTSWRDWWSSAWSPDRREHRQQPAGRAHAAPASAPPPAR